MKCIFATYEHTCIGFGKVVLKWHVNDGKMGTAYVVVKGIIEGNWTWTNPYPLPFIDFELKKFDDYVRNRFTNDASVQD
jgi:hypothetical protein